MSKVLDELKPYNFKIVIVLEKEDIETIEAAHDKNCEILYQKNKGYGDALIQGLITSKVNYSAFLTLMVHSIHQRSIV